jgi:hypothetical protein
MRAGRWRLSNAAATAVTVLAFAVVFWSAFSDEANSLVAIGAALWGTSVGYALLQLRAIDEIRPLPLIWLFGSGALILGLLATGKVGM